MKSVKKIPWLFHYLDNKEAWKAHAGSIITHNIEPSVGKLFSRKYSLELIGNNGLGLYDLSGDVLLRSYIPSDGQFLVCYFEPQDRYILSKTLVRILEKYIAKAKAKKAK